MAELVIELVVGAVWTPIVQPLVACCVITCCQPLRDCQAGLPDRPQPYRWAASNFVAYLPVALLWSAFACEAATFAPSQYVATLPLTNASAVAAAGVDL